MGIAIGGFPEEAAALKVKEADSAQVISLPATATNLGAVQQNNPPRIQIAILLDVSGSMGGLIDQTKNQLWSIVNEFSAVTRNGQTPQLEVALYEYGNGDGANSKNYIRQLNSFTRELDLVSEGLFSLQTSGSSEYCGAAIESAVSGLQWSQSDNDIKAIFIAGNEEFNQGPIDYGSALELAVNKGIAVSTIYAGDSSHSDAVGWKSGAQLAGGSYMSINSDQQIVHVDAPQDQRIAQLNSKLNDTYIPYGELGVVNSQRQLEQDEKNQSISSGLLAKRAKAKSSSYYSNSSWDLVDALNQGEIKDAELSTLKKEQLPEVMRGMSAQQRKDYVNQQAKERSEISQEIARLSKAREQYVIGQRKEQAEQGAGVGDALLAAVKSQAIEKGFEIDGKVK